MHLVIRGCFRSRHNDCGYTVRPAIAENPMLHANLMALDLCFIEAELRPIEVLHCGNTHFSPVALN